jgi:acetyl-CoA C-acetyltransferase
MVDALIIDACRTPRGIGKAGKGALSGIHPQQLGATVLRALADRTGIDTSDVDDIIWGTSSQRGQQSGDLGRMSALDAGYDVRASGVTLDRFCGSGITSVNMAAASIMSGLEDLVIAGGTEMMSMEGRRGEGPFMMDAGNLRLRARHPQSHQGVCADAVATLERITRQDVDALGLESQKRAANAIKGGHFDKSLVAVHREDDSLALEREEYPRPQTTLEGLAGLKPAFTAVADYPLDDKGTTYRKLILQKYPDLDIQFVRRGRRFGGDSAGVPELREGAWHEAARARCRDGEYGRLADTDAECAGPGDAQGAGQGRPHAGRYRPVRDQRGLCGSGREIHQGSRSRPR